MVIRSLVSVVDDDESEIVEVHVTLEDCVRADEDIDLSRGEAFEQCGPGLFLQTPDDELNGNRKVPEEPPQRGGVLFGKDFGRGHEGTLLAVVDGHEKRQEQDACCGCVDM